MNQLILSHYSYAQQRAVTSPWWEVFERDIRAAQNIFFLGYELNDFEPASYLTKNPALIDKTHFILRASKSPVTENRLQQYGTRHSIEISGFAAECEAAVIRERPEHPNALSSFKYVDILKDSKTAAKPSAIEIQALFAFGKFNYQRLISTFPRSAYISVRSQTLSQSVDRIKNAKTLILHSKTGNGKTIFRHGLTVALSQSGYACFELRENLTPLQSDLEFLKRQEKAVVIFPDYDTAYANIHLFSEMREDVTFIIEMNTSTLQVRQSEVFKRISNPIERIDLNRLTREDCNEIHGILDEAGIAPRDFKFKFGPGSEFRDIVLSIFENSEIIKKIDSIITPLMLDGNAKFVIMCSAILRVAGINTDPTFLRSISKVDPFQILTQIGESAYEFVDFSHDRVEPHSALFSEFLIKRYLQPHELSGAVFRMAAEAARRMNEEDSFQSTRARNARSTLGALLRFSFLDDVLRHHPERSQHMQDIYENGRRDEYIQGEPLFWLQYSIFMQDIGRWDLAEKHIDTAYKRGESRPEFLTYQLDTNYLGLCIELELKNPRESSVIRAPRMIELLEKSRSMIGEGNHRGHVLKVLDRIEKFVQNRREGLSKSEAVAFVYHLNLISDELEKINIEDKIILGSEQVRQSLNRAVSHLTSYNHRSSA